MFSELRDFFTVTLIKRLSSPFLSTFIFALAFTNYDVVFLSLSSTDWKAKVLYIQSLNVFFDSFYRVFVPLLVSLFYVLIWPYFDMYFYKKSKQASFSYKQLQKQIEDDAPMTREEEQAFKQRWSDRFNSYQKQINDKDALISDLESQLKDAQNKISELTISNKPVQRKVFLDDDVKNNKTESYSDDGDEMTKDISKESPIDNEKSTVPSEFFSIISAFKEYKFTHLEVIGIYHKYFEYNKDAKKVFQSYSFLKEFGFYAGKIKSLCDALSRLKLTSLQLEMTHDLIHNENEISPEEIYELVINEESL